MSCFLLLYFGSLHRDYIQVFYFVTALAPVAIRTTYVFSEHLLPKLIAEHCKRLTIYLTIILSLGLEFLILKLSLSIYQVELASVLYIESIGDYVMIRLKNEKELKSKMKISHLAKELPESFIHIHQAFLINCNKIEQYSKEKLYINGIDLPISRTYRKEVRLLLAKKSSSSNG